MRDDALGQKIANLHDRIQGDVGNVDRSPSNTVPASPFPDVARSNAFDASMGALLPLLNVTSTTANFLTPSTPAAYSEGSNGCGFEIVRDTPSGHVAVDPNFSAASWVGAASVVGAAPTASCTAALRSAAGGVTSGPPPQPGSNTSTPTTAAPNTVRLMGLSLQTHVRWLPRAAVDGHRSQLIVAPPRQMGYCRSCATPTHRSVDATHHSGGRDRDEDHPDDPPQPGLG